MITLVSWKIEGLCHFVQKKAFNSIPGDFRSWFNFVWGPFSFIRTLNLTANLSLRVLLMIHDFWRNSLLLQVISRNPLNVARTQTFIHSMRYVYRFSPPRFLLLIKFQPSNIDVYWNVFTRHINSPPFSLNLKLFTVRIVYLSARYSSSLEKYKAAAMTDISLCQKKPTVRVS